MLQEPENRNQKVPSWNGGVVLSEVQELRGWGLRRFIFLTDTSTRSIFQPPF